MGECVRDKLIRGQKLLLVFHEISKENFSVTDDTILEKLYTHIESTVEIKDLIDPLNTEIGDWLETIVNEWEERKLFHGVKIFVLRFIGYVCSSVEGFKILREKNILNLIQKLVTHEQFQKELSLVVPLIDTLSMILKHQDGWIWMMKTGIWKYAVTTYYEDRSIYIKRAAVKFLSSLLCTSEIYNGKVTEIWSFICEPLIFNNLLIVEDSCDKTSEKKLTSPEECHSSCNVESLIHYQSQILGRKKVNVTIQLIKSARFLCDILEYLLLSKGSIPGKLRLANQHNGLTEESTIISDILKHSSTHKDIDETFSLLVLLIDLSNIVKDTTSCYEYCTLQPWHKKIESILQLFCMKHNFQALIQFCVSTVSWKSKLSKRNQETDCCLLCENWEKDMLSFMSACLHIYTCCCGHQYFCKNEESNYLIAVEQLIGEHFLSYITQECSCSRRDIYLSIKDIQSAVFGFKSFIHFLSVDKLTIILSDVENTIKPEWINLVRKSHISSYGPLLTNLFSLLTDILEIDRRLKALHLIEKCKYILDISSNDVRMTVTSLQALKKVIKIDLLPNFVIDWEVNLDISKHLSGLVLMLNSLSWEVRDTILEVYQTMIDPGELTPPDLIKLFNNQLLQEILDIASKDVDSYVRASALNFYSRAVRGKLFQYIISPSILCDVAIKVLLEDNMAVVRHASCQLITALYVTYPPNLLCETNKIYEVMFVAATNDLDWEVKTSALRFWQCTVEKHLMEENVPMTVYLHSTNKDEIISKIKVVLNKLCEIGCLKAIWLGVKDDCDLKVCEEAQHIINYFEVLNNQWDYVNGINNCNDLEESTVAEPRHLKVKEFIYLLQNQEWRKVLDSRRDWIETKCDDLTSLLDHILNVDYNRINDWDHNTVDCY